MSYVLFIFWRLIPCQTYGLKIFSLILRLPFHSVDSFLSMQKYFSLMYSHLFIFVFVACEFGAKSINHCQGQYHEIFSCVLFESFIILDLCFKCLVLFLSWSLCKVWNNVKFHSFPYGYSVYPILFAEERSLSPLCILGILDKDQFAEYVWVYFWTTNSVSLVCITIFMTALMTRAL